MYLRLVNAKSGGTTRRYAQLVQSRRRPEDGVVVKDVVANLGQLDDLEVANIRAALQASRDRDSVVVSVPTLPTKPRQNLQYLDIAVLLELMRRLGIDRLLQKLLPIGNALVAPADVVMSLVIHRCVAAGSKRHATSWFTRTALPELLGVPANALENTRLHSVLDCLDEVTEELMRLLAATYLDRDPSFAALFMDITTAWFVGRGPEELAQYGRAKDHAIRRQIAILLVCNEHGYPLRWQVAPGNCAESTVMIEQFRSLRSLTWARDVPTIVDRALGRSAYLEQLLELGNHFVTALVRREILTYVNDLPSQKLAECELEGTRTQKREALGTCVESAGFSKVLENLYCRDVGVVQREVQTSPQLACPEDRCRSALQAVREVLTAVATGTAASERAAATARGLKQGAYFKYKNLTRLTESLQIAVLEGQARDVTLKALILVAKMPADEQTEAFDALVARSKPKRKRAEQSTPQPSDAPTASIRLRAVAYFNPDMFLDQREKAQKKLDKVERKIDELNDELAAPRSRRDRDAVVAAVDRILRKASLLDTFDSTIVEPDALNGHFSVRLTLNDTEWKRRRALDGWSVLVTRPDCEIPASELCLAYRNKDVVETDFRVIKSCVELRPVWHRNESKVRAHVTICMLALLLERHLRRTLGDRGTVEPLLEELRDCNLNRYGSDEPNGDSLYLISHANAAQIAALKHLEMSHLTDDMLMSDRIHPR